jgi:hypothetical protein
MDLDQLRDLYGLDLPVSLEQFARFWDDYPFADEELLGDALGLTPTGPLDLLLRVDDGAAIVAEPSILLHWRFHRDPPELFTCLHGNVDGLHLGLLLDDPERGFRGAASFYNNDGDLIRVYGGLFDAVLVHVGQMISGTEENLVDDPAEADHYQAELDGLRRFDARLRSFIAAEGIKIDEGRGPTIPSDTGLGIVVPGGDRGWEEAKDRALDVAAPVEELVDRCRQGDPVPALAAGRSRWYWGGQQRSADAFVLLQAAYEETGRTELLRVLELHARHRDLRSVDLVRRAR